MERKLKVATASLGGCFGCHMSLLDIDERILELLEFVEFDMCPITDIKEVHKCDIGLIEGGATHSENVEVLREFRNQCRILVSVGDCAIMGGIPALRNNIPIRECLEEAFINGPSVVDGMIPNDPDIPVMLDRVYPLHEIVKIDFHIPGCPPPADTLWEAIVALANGKELELPYELIKYD